MLWIGAVAAPGATGDVYACGPCIAELAHMVRVQAHTRDRITDRAALPATLAVPAHVPPPRPVPVEGSGGRHRSVRRERDAYPTALPAGTAR
ncbi:hypothetical protein ACFWR9_05870 [Streptomyces sp. NPDC058534]|uniref:hypothetical protein n=1 Tax=Streptomyces sp. NPDC058534 TaxID=3346541 RepID=UPI0036645FEE